MFKIRVIRALGSLPATPKGFGWSRGAVMERDILLTCPKTSIKLIFDVGANVGDVALRYVRRFPKATIFCFEPLPALYKQLQARTKRLDSVECVPVAVSNASGSFRFVDYGPQSSSSHLLSSLDGNLPQRSEKTILVKTTTIDDFCLSRDIHRIDLLKIDVEGNDFDVLKGALRKLENQNVGFISIECGFDPDNKRHVDFFDIKEFLYSFGYKVFGFYEQTSEFFKAEPQLRRADVVFISEQEILKNAGISRRKPKSLLDLAISIKRILGK